MPLGNLIVAGAILFSGNSPCKVLNMMRHAGIQTISNRTYNYMQTAYVVPAVNSVWDFKQQIYLNSVRDSNHALKLGGDARCSSPGHTAKYGSYSVMDLPTSKIVDIQLVQSNEVKNSNAMELEGLKRCLSFIEREQIPVTHLVTDRHVQVKKYLKEQKPEIQHMFDVWHVAKGIYKKIEKKGKRKGLELLGKWARSTSNHLYWCATSSKGNGEELVQKWKSVLNHAADIHEGHGALFETCLHGPLEDRAWLRKGSTAFHELEKIVAGKLLLKDIRQLSPAEQTSGLESFHNIVCFFAPKSTHFFHSQMKARLYLSALHFNETRVGAKQKQQMGDYNLASPILRQGREMPLQKKSK